MPIKMLALDLDNTLLRSDKTISPYSAGVLARCREQGIKVVFATARPKRKVSQFCENVYTDALVVHNGADIYLGDRLYCSFGIASDIKDELLLSLSQHYPNATLSVEIDDVIYANFEISAIWNETGVIRTDFTDLPDRPAEKIIVGAIDTDRFIDLETLLPDDLYLEINDAKLGLIMHRDATKLNAIQTVAAHFGLTADEIAAFGDDYNDVCMLKGCGTGVAMGNALGDVKAAADFVCGDNDSDGAARWIEENIL